jgi:GT2 family glycosyltransferase
MKRAKHSPVTIAAEHAVAAKNTANSAQIFESVTAAGYVDIFGYSNAAGGWLFSGWIPRPFRTNQPDLVECLTQFEQSQFKGSVTLSFYQREDLDHTRIGVVAFASGSSRSIGNLRCLSFTLDGVTYQIHAGSSTARLNDQEIVDRIRVTLTNQSFANRNRDHLLAVTSRPRFTGQDTLTSLSEPVFLEIDEAILCPPGDVLLKGWLLSVPGAIRSIRIRSGPLAVEVDLAESISIARPDVITAIGHQHGFSEVRCGFVSFVPAAISTGDITYFEIELQNNEIGFKNLRISKRSGMNAIKQILEGIDVRYGEVDPAFDSVLGPAIFALNAARLQKSVSPHEIQFGQTPENPTYSLIIPLYGRIDFVEYQMALFSRHAGIQQAEIIYVLDDPPKRRELELLAHSVYQRFGIPFRVLLLPSNLGFAPANNVGLRGARGEFICFLNSDIFPITDGWMEDLIDHSRRNPEIGIIGPRLLFEDGSIQHEGCYFKKIEEFGNWMFVDHHNKGRRPTNTEDLQTYEVITGACMVMRRSLALDLGGFDESFIIGDFEDADLCLKVRARGLSCAIASDVQLYHLERKSQAAPNQNWRMNLTLYNGWVHQRRWFGPVTPILGNHTDSV